MKTLWPPNVPLMLLATAIVAVSAALARTGGEALLGFDAYPLIAASRVDSIGAFFGTFGEELMDGRYPDGAFYRPLVHLTFAFDHAVGGLDPGRYHATDVLICLVAAWLIGLVAARSTGGTTRARGAAGLGAVLLFVMHRAQLDVVPYAARRADALSLLFIAATTLATLRGARPWAIAGLALCAFLSKESGVIAVPIAFAAGYARDGATAKSAARGVLAPAVGVGVGLVARTLVLGGLGGHAESGTIGIDGARVVASSLWRALTSEVALGPWVVLGLLIGILGSVLRGGARGGRCCALLALVWMASALAITLVSGRYHDWYVLAILPGIALAAGAGLAQAVERSHTVDLLVGAAALALIVLFATASLRTDQRNTLRAAERISADQVERFRTQVAPLGPGESVDFAPWVFAVVGRPGDPPVFVHAPYSLDALGDLTLSGTPVVAIASDQVVGPRPDAVLVRLVPGPPPASALEPPPSGR